MARLQADENFPWPAVKELRLLGHDVLTTQEAGTAGLALSDLKILEDAAAQDRAVLTLNRRHFIRLHREQPWHAGMIVCTFDSDFVRLAARIDAMLTNVPSLAGELLRVYRPG